MEQTNYVKVRQNVVHSKSFAQCFDSIVTKITCYDP